MDGAKLKIAEFLHVTLALNPHFIVFYVQVSATDVSSPVSGNILI
jgi:hypothetical protein